MTHAADDFDAIRRAMEGLQGEPDDDRKIAADDLAEDSACPRFRCDGRLVAGRDEEIGCSCHLSTPCGGCCPGVLTCNACKEVFRYEGA
jgi:hypothetical protein